MRRVVLLVLSGVLLGALLTGAAGALPGSQDLNALTWLSSVATIAALVVAVGIYRVQQSQSDIAHQELLDALKAQDEILQALAETTPPDAEPASADANAPAPAPSPDPTQASDEDDSLTAAQRHAIEEQYPEQSIETAWTLGRRGGRGGRGERPGGPRLVRLDDGTLLTVFTGGRNDETHVHRVGDRDAIRVARHQQRQERARRQRPDQPRS